MLTAIETVGTIEINGQVKIDEKFPVDEPTQVKVILLFPDEDDLGERDWLQAAGKSSAFDFLDDDAEDIYSMTDGKPIQK